MSVQLEQTSSDSPKGCIFNATKATAEVEASSVLMPFWHRLSVGVLLMNAEFRSHLDAVNLCLTFWRRLIAGDFIVMAIVS